MTYLDRLEAVAKGATINGTYRKPVGEALEAFKTDLMRVVLVARGIGK